MGKRVLSAMLALVLCVGLVPGTAWAADSVFEIDSNGVLTRYRGAGGDVTIPDSVNSIGNGAFYGCSSLTSVTIPDSVNSIENQVFDECSSLASIEVDAANGYYSSEGGVLFDKHKTKLIIFPRGRSKLNTIPSSVTSIGEWAFSTCSSLTSVIIPNSVTSIGEWAFSDCGNLTSVTISNSVISIGEWAFYDCRSLTSVTIPNSVTSIGESAFYNCSSLTSVTIPNSVASIGNSVFCGCSSLTSVTIPSSVTSIEHWAFYVCSSLANVYYGGSEAQWKTIKFGWYNEPLTHTTIHYNSKLINGQIVTIESTLSIPDGQYCIHVIDKDGQPIKNASITYDKQSATTGNDGSAYFNLFTALTPLITVNKEGYTTWTNEKSGWQMNIGRYDTIVLYPENQETNENSVIYKLKSAKYESNGIWSDVLTSTKKINLFNDGNLIGDLTLHNGAFNIYFATFDKTGIDHYEFWQKNTKIATAQRSNNVFNLNIKSFSKGGGCFIRVVTSDSKRVDTNINLEFAENTVQKETGVSLMKNKIGITVSDDVPFLGGSTFNVGGIGLLPVEIKATEDKVYIGFNAKIWESGDTSSSQAQGKFDKFKKSLDSVKKANAA